MTTLKYLHKDGSGKATIGLSQAELAKAVYCQKVFGPLERPLEIGERISATGAIEKVPPTAEQTEQETRRQQAKAVLAALNAGTATSAQVQQVLAFLVKNWIGG